MSNVGEGAAGEEGGDAAASSNGNGGSGGGSGGGGGGGGCREGGGAGSDVSVFSTSLQVPRADTATLSAFVHNSALGTCGWVPLVTIKVRCVYLGGRAVKGSGTDGWLGAPRRPQHAGHVRRGAAGHNHGTGMEPKY